MRILRHRAKDLIGPDTPEGVVTFYWGEKEQIWTPGVAEDAPAKKSGDFCYILFVPSPEHTYNGAFPNYSLKIPVAYSFNSAREKVTPHMRSSAITAAITRRDRLACSMLAAMHRQFYRKADGNRMLNSRKNRARHGGDLRDVKLKTRISHRRLFGRT